MDPKVRLSPIHQRRRQGEQIRSHRSISVARCVVAPRRNANVSSTGSQEAATTPTPGPSTAETSILPIITSQRDRFRTRNAELEEVRMPAPCTACPGYGRPHRNCASNLRPSPSCGPRSRGCRPTICSSTKRSATSSPIATAPLLLPAPPRPDSGRQTGGTRSSGSTAASTRRA
jgi:hypothetical protein